MDEIKSLIKSRMKICLSAMSSTSTSEKHANEAQAVEHLAKALSCLDQIKEEK